MLPLTVPEASVTTPPGSCPLAARPSHSQPTSWLPIEVDVPAAWFSRPVKRHTRSLPCAALTSSGKFVLLLSPMYWPPSSAFSGWLGPAGSRHVVVGMPLGSVGPDWKVL